MSDWQLPPELESLERELAARSASQPTAELRQKITSGVHNRLRRESRLDFWRFAAAAALVAAVWLNLSLTAASVTDFHFQLADNRPSAERTVRQIKDLLPEMSETDARREALLLCTSANLAMYPKITVSHAAITQMGDFKDLLP
ncbi:MAG: hypothetical protein ABSG67_06970 [Thermoguttaceae bacterium]|jgi:hypothetical protein